jgi:hypothetical protein
MDTTKKPLAGKPPAGANAKPEECEQYFTDSTPEVHPVCLLLPDMSEEEFNALKSDIEQHGLQQPILLHPNGQILDGRHRARACNELGVDARFETWSGTDPVAFVLSTNLFRRHLTPSQRAMIAAQAMDHYKAEAEVRMKAGGTLASSDARVPAKGKSAATAAAAVGVSQASVERAAAIVRDGTPEDVQAVMRGEATVAAKAGEVKARAYTGRSPESASRTHAEIVDSPPTTQPPHRPAGPPKATAKDALHRALTVTAALAELDKVAHVLDRDDARRIVAQLEDALVRYRALAEQGKEGGSDA